MILSGDMFQLPPPVPKVTLYDAVVKQYAEGRVLKGGIDSPANQGAHLFTKFRKIELSKQMRASEDPLHTKMLDNMRNISIEHPITKKMVDNFIYHSALDFKQNSKWL